jgi:hypothetical protein
MTTHPPPHDNYDSADDLSRSVEFAYRHIRERVMRGGRGWRGYPTEMTNTHLEDHHEYQSL